jgi:hypothetical protein
MISARPVFGSWTVAHTVHAGVTVTSKQLFLCFSQYKGVYTLSCTMSTPTRRNPPRQARLRPLLDKTTVKEILEMGKGESDEDSWDEEDDSIESSSDASDLSDDSSDDDDEGEEDETVRAPPAKKARAKKA